MTTQTPWQCRCGALQGQLLDASPDTGNHLVCMCDDCQDYAHHLGASELLDANGGTEIFQVSVDKVTFEAGVEQLRCVRLTEKGLMRWYAGCCKTPIANTMGPKGPFAGVFPQIIDKAVRAKVTGPIRAKTQGRYGKGPLPPDASKTAPIGFMFRAAKMMVGWMLKGAARRSPFFDRAGTPIVTPEIVPAEERERLRQTREALS